MSEREHQHGEALEDLDAFLDEFGRHPEGSDPADTATQVEALTQDEAGEFAALQLDAAMDTAAADTVEVPELRAGDAVLATEYNLDMTEEARRAAVAATTTDELFDFPPDPVPTARAAGDMRGERITIMAAEDVAPVAAKRGVDVSIGGLALFALLVAAGAVWYALNLQGQLTELRAELAQPRQAAGFVSGPDLQTQEEIGRLNQRVNELSVQLEGPTASLSEANQRELADIFSRLDGIEKAVTDMRDELAALQRSSKGAAATAAVAAPASTKVKPVAPEGTAKVTAATTSKSSRRGNWIVNIASLTDAKAAAAEQQRLRKEGIEVEVQEVVMSGRTWYRVRAVGFASREEAQVYGDMLREHVSGTPWVGQK